MEIIGAGLANVAGILVFALAAAILAKAFQIAATLTEIKELLTDIKRNTDTGTPGAPYTPFASTEAAENLIRAVSAELDHPVAPAPPDYQR